MPTEEHVVDIAKRFFEGQKMEFNDIRALAHEVLSKNPIVNDKTAQGYGSQEG